MPGFELFGDSERQEVNDVLDSGILMRYGFDKLRKGHWKAKELETELKKVVAKLKKLESMKEKSKTKTKTKSKGKSKSKSKATKKKTTTTKPKTTKVEQKPKPKTKAKPKTAKKVPDKSIAELFNLSPTSSHNAEFFKLFSTILSSFSLSLIPCFLRYLAANFFLLFFLLNLIGFSSSFNSKYLDLKIPF